ncbi:hypothetical protein LCGC14_0390620 [marine sediment metagenome]|uniref:Uncharacterized protein n=1 Tax=marine sediment metagenome TaxID=412755 RepID=A0A0F9THR0_9ZZZZ
MIWLKTHIVEIFAVIGALYSIARVVVALTPTPKDNIALEKIGVQLRAIARVFGLDLTQGISKPKK